MALSSEVFAFDRFELRPAIRQLRVDGTPAPVGARAFDVLLALIERRDRLVGKSELLDLVWPDVVVEENNLQVQISALRKLLGPAVTATVPGRGYRFVATLDDEAAMARGSAAPRSPASAPSAAAHRATNLPAQLPRLYGRDDDLDALGALVLHHRLVTVVGAGGIGKSRLAEATAQAQVARFPEGAWRVELAGLSDAALVPQAVAQVLAAGDRTLQPRRRALGSRPDRRRCGHRAGAAQGRHGDVHVQRRQHRHVRLRDRRGDAVDTDHAPGVRESRNALPVSRGKSLACQST